MSVGADEAQERYFEGEVIAALPLALLEAVRANDRPLEVLEDEDVTVSLPRRLGLSGVVENQIQRYESAQRAGRTVSLNEVFALIRLVLRRPDAEEVLRDTGQRVAAWRYQRVPQLTRRLYRSLPLRLALVGVARRTRRLFRDLSAGEHVLLHRHPFGVIVRRSRTAELDPSGVACTLLTAALEEHVSSLSGRAWSVQHVQCASRGSTICEWRAEPV